MSYVCVPYVCALGSQRFAFLRGGKRISLDTIKGCEESGACEVKSDLYGIDLALNEGWSLLPAHLKHHANKAGSAMVNGELWIIGGLEVRPPLEPPPSHG